LVSRGKKKEKKKKIVLGYLLRVVIKLQRLGIFGLKNLANLGNFFPMKKILCIVRKMILKTLKFTKKFMKIQVLF
jgi:hypothetical protein